MCKKHEVNNKNETIRKSGTTGFIEFPRTLMKLIEVSSIRKRKNLIFITMAILMMLAMVGIIFTIHQRSTASHVLGREKKITNVSEDSQLQEDETKEEDSKEEDSKEIKKDDTLLEELVTPIPKKEDSTTEESTQEVLPLDKPEDIYTTARLRFREQPSLSANILDLIKDGTKLQKVGTCGEWDQVVYEEKTGFVSHQYTTTEAPVLTEQDAEAMEKDAESSSQSKNATNSNFESNGWVVVLDPGHQSKGNSEKEPIGPGATESKAKVSSGTQGCVSGWAEYELNLTVGLLLRDELEQRGYTVYMTREENNVNLSNKERAEYAEEVGGDILVRIHANGSENSKVSGALCVAPSSKNKYIPDLIEESQRLSRCVIDAYCDATGLRNKGLYLADNMSGINWSTMPVTIVEMGYMTNRSDDSNMADPKFEKKIVTGIADGIDCYFQE